MFEDKVDREELDKMPSEYKELLERVLTIQADCEIGGPHLYVKDILPSAPSKVNQLIVARTAAEEMDHYRKVARLAGEIGKDTSIEYPESEALSRSLSRRDHDMGGFLGFRLFDRSRGALSAGRISRLQLFAVATYFARGSQRRGGAYRVWHQSNSGIGGEK